MVEVAYRFGDRTNLYTAESGLRGSGIGAPALQLRTAFSGERSSHRPYLEATLLRTGTIGVALEDLDGNSAGTATIAPSSVAQFLAGVEVLTRSTNQGWFALDFLTRAAYFSHAELPSGLLLPDVLSDTEGTAVTRSEYAVFSAGLGFRWQLFQYLRLGVSADLDVNTPYRVEHPYPIRVGTDSVGVRIYSFLRFMIR